MHIELWLIRHGMTPGNAEGRYVGRTDEGLSPEGRGILQRRQLMGFYPEITELYVSPMKRCKETAAIIFPKGRQFIVEGLRECDFGDFEYKNYRELNGNPAYQAWIDGGGRDGFPGGESLGAFQERVVRAFDKAVCDLCMRYNGQTIPGQRVALVAHGGTLMAILDRYARPHKDYFEWQTKNGCGYVAGLDTEQWAAGNCYLTVQYALEVVQ